MKQRVLLRGMQGLDLLHRISSTDILGLPQSQKKPGLILNPQGRILSFFEISRTADDSVEIEFEDEFLKHLDHYTFSERYDLTMLPAETGSDLPPLDRVRALIPREGFEFHPDGQTNPLEVNLRSAIADQKGCYPGQEVIEKIISLGSPAKRLCLLRRSSGSDPIPLPALLTSGTDENAGTLTTLVQDEGLAVVKRTYCKVGTRLQISNQEWIVEKVSE